MNKDHVKEALRRIRVGVRLKDGESERRFPFICGTPQDSFERMFNSPERITREAYRIVVTEGHVGAIVQEFIIDPRTGKISQYDDPPGFIVGRMFQEPSVVYLPRPKGTYEVQPTR